MNALIKIICSLHSFFILGVMSALTACGGYAVTLNQQPVYQPKPLLEVAGIIDPQLLGCAEQIISDNKIANTSQFTIFICTSARVSDLSGIEQFKSLRQISLANNNLETIASLGKIRTLTEVNLEGNPALNCAEIKEIKLIIGEKLKVTAPAHCL